MRCSSCDFENAAGKKFCIRCGVAFGARCPKCGSENPPEASYCGDCGVALSQPTAAPAVSRARSRNHHCRTRRTTRNARRRAAPSDGAVLRSGRLHRDRRHLDPEEWRETVGRLPSRGGGGDNALRRPCRQVPRRRRDGVLRLSRGARQRRGACRARGPGDSRRHIQAQRAARAPQAGGAGRDRFRRGGGGRGRRQRRRRIRRHAQYRRAGAGSRCTRHGAGNRRIRIG